MKNTQSFLVLIAVAIVAAGCARTQPQPTQPTPVATATVSPPPEKTATAPARIGGNLIYVPEQTPGRLVTVAQVGVEQPGYVVIHRAEGGKPGTIIGASSLIAAGDHANLTVTLTQGTADGQSFFAMLHRDNGDGQFDANPDVPVQDQSGSVMMMEFTVSVDASPPGAIQF